MRKNSTKRSHFASVFVYKSVLHRPFTFKAVK